MEFSELVKARYSVRSFDPRKVEKADLDRILQAGQAAPTACNNQPQRILVLDKEEDLKKVEKFTRSLYGAPMALLVCADTNVSWKRHFDNKDHAEVDACIVATHMMLKAAELGLGTTWIGSFDSAGLREAFVLPANLELVCLFPLGYPSQTSKPVENHFIRNPLSETVFYDHF